MVATTQSGDYLLAGTSQAFHPTSDIVLARLDGEGALKWAKAIDGSAEDKLLGLVSYPDGGSLLLAQFTYLSGAAELGVFRLSAEGSLLWAREIAGVDLAQGA